jgi:pimeloyl-ACP methyl ester carboxylesterase
VPPALLPATPIHAESARYATSLVFLPGLWAGPGVWRAAAGYLAHRGWEGQLLDLRAVAGGIGTRAAAVAAHVAVLPTPPVLIGHDAGALVALAATAAAPAAAVVLLAPLVAGSPSARALTVRWSLLPRTLLGWPMHPPADALRALSLHGLPGRAQQAVLAEFGPESAVGVIDVARGSAPAAAPGVPALLVAGSSDPLLAPTDAAALAGTVGADHRQLEGAGHWLLAGPGWERTVGTVHRWLVQRLGASLLEFYPEAMAEREADDSADE